MSNDQGQLGSASSHATASAIEMLQRDRGKPVLDPRLAIPLPRAVDLVAAAEALKVEALEQELESTGQSEPAGEDS